MRLSMRSACPYITGKTEQRIAVDIDFQPSVHDSLARAGFRRVENWVYRPAVRTAMPAAMAGECPPISARS